MMIRVAQHIVSIHFWMPGNLLMALDWQYQNQQHIGIRSNCYRGFIKEMIRQSILFL